MVEKLDSPVAELNSGVTELASAAEDVAALISLIVDEEGKTVEPSIKVDKTTVRVHWEQASLEQKVRAITVVSVLVVVECGGGKVVSIGSENEVLSNVEGANTVLSSTDKVLETFG